MLMSLEILFFFKCMEAYDVNHTTWRKCKIMLDIRLLVKNGIHHLLYMTAVPVVRG